MLGPKFVEVITLRKINIFLDLIQDIVISSKYNIGNFFYSFDKFFFAEHGHKQKIFFEKWSIFALIRR